MRYSELVREFNRGLTVKSQQVKLDKNDDRSEARAEILRNHTGIIPKGDVKLGVRLVSHIEGNVLELTWTVDVLHEHDGAMYAQNMSSVTHKELEAMVEVKRVLADVKDSDLDVGDTLASLGFRGLI